MIATLMPKSSITEALTFEDHLACLSDFQSLQALKQGAWTAFSELPMPSPMNQNWRFSNTKDLLLDAFCSKNNQDTFDPSEFIIRSNLVQDPAGRLIFVDDNLVEHDPFPNAKKLVFTSFSQALWEHEDIIVDALKKSTTQLGSEKFQALQLALTHSGTVLIVPKGCTVPGPIVVYHWISEENTAIFPTTVVIAEESSEVDLIEIFLSKDSHVAGFCASNAILIAGPNASIRRKTIQGFNENTVSFQFDSSHVEKDARVETVAVNFGAQRARYENHANLLGEGSDARLYSLTVSANNQEFDQRTLQVHQAPHTTSDLLYKNALLENAKTIFSGLIRVNEGAQKTDAYQTNRNLLLSPTAEADSMPGLEIEANDVKCSHGSTTGKLDATQLFYLKSRGIPQKKAQELLVFGFIEEILQLLPDSTLTDGLHRLLEQKFNAQ